MENQNHIYFQNNSIFIFQNSIYFQLQQQLNLFKMINNNPYNVPQKSPMSKSKILTQYPFPGNVQNLQKRQENECMYGSGMFMKRSMMSNNNQAHQHLIMQQPIKVPVSPSHSFKPLSVQFFTSPYQNIQSNKESFIQKAIKQINEKLSRVNFKLDNHDNMLTSIFQKKQNNSQREISTTSISTFNNDNEFQNNDSQCSKKQFQQMKRQSQLMKRSISVIQYKIQQQIHPKIIDQSRNLFLPMIQRMTAIETTIRQMGEDIHLINDKQQNLTEKIQNKFKQLNHELSKIKNSLNANYESSIQQLNGQLYKTQLSINKLTRDIQLKMEQPIKQQSKNNNQISKLRVQVAELNLRLKQKSFSHFSSSSVLSQKCLVLKYLQKFQIVDQFKNSVQKQIQINELTYYIDYDGCILDTQRFYLVDDKGDKIRLNESHIQLLKNNHILI